MVVLIIHMNRCCHGSTSHAQIYSAHNVLVHTEAHSLEFAFREENGIACKCIYHCNGNFVGGDFILRKNGWFF